MSAVAPTALPDDLLEATIRPKRLSEYLGQEPIKKELNIYIQAALKRKEALDHVLLFGPPGLGKTTLSHIVATEMGSLLHETSGPVLEKGGDVAALLMNIRPNDVLFIDEIHRMSPAAEEVLYPAMEDFAIDLLLGDGPDKKSIRLTVPPFTLVAATTRSGMLSAPLRDRFGILQHLQYYTPAELTQIVNRSAQIFGVTIDPEAAHNIAQRSRGTPRIANRLLRRVRDLAQVHHNGQISVSVVNEALDMLGINIAGLDRLDQNILAAIATKFKGGPVGLETLAASVGEEKGTLEDVVEPFLIQQGFLLRTSRGRQLTESGYAQLGLPPP